MEDASHAGYAMLNQTRPGRPESIDRHLKRSHWEQ